MSDEGDRLEDTVHVIHGSAGTGAVRRVLYAVYLTLVFSLTYGFTLARGVFVTSNPQWVADHLVGPVGAAALAVATGAALVAAWQVGRVRGPVVPPLPWTDLVVSTSLDRALVLRRWWMYAVVGASSCLAVVAGVVGGGLWASGATGPAALVAGVVGGGVLGAGLALAALHGQAEGIQISTPPRMLRSLRLEGLRQHGVRSARLGGAVLAGDLRAARLEVATPVRRGRGLRLRPGRPLPTIARRDLLGLRRQPLVAALGLLLVAPGCAALAWVLTEPAVPAFVACLASLTVHTGIGVWSEGLRLHADNLGTPPLTGLPPGREALAHASLPALLTLAVWTVVGGAVWWLLGSPTAAVPAVVQLAGSAVAATALLVGTAWLAAFRGRPPVSAFLPDSGPLSMVSWWVRPGLAATASGAIAAIGSRGIGPGLLLATLAAIAVVVAWCRARFVDCATAHRD